MPATVFADSVSLGKRIYNICHLQVTDTAQLIIKWTLFDYVSTLTMCYFWVYYYQRVTLNARKNT